MVQIDTGVLLWCLGVFLTWAAFITKITFDNQSKLKTSEANDEIFKEQFEKTCKDLTDSFDEMKKEVKEDFKSINQRMDIFMKQEIDTLKKIADR